MKKKYNIDELELKNDTEEEQLRTREIFENLKLRAESNSEFLEREKNFFCTCLKLSSKENDRKPTDFSICENYIFKELYLTYFHNNLSGPFYKAIKGELVEVSHNEKVYDFKFLTSISKKWEKMISVTNHSDQVLREISIETNRDLKQLKKKYSGLSKIFRKQQDDYELKKDKIILQSKFIYLLVIEVIQNNPKEDFEIPFNNEIIEFTIYSLVHIISRHYAEPIKGNEEKTYHYGNFYPTELHIDLKNILIKIGKLKKIDINETDNIIFIFKDTYYQLYIQKRNKQIKGKGNVEIFRIQTFYPIYEKRKTEEIKRVLNLVQIDKNLSVFAK